jgi:hypothetical protein
MEHIGTHVLPAVVARIVSTYSGLRVPEARWQYERSMRRTVPGLQRVL